MLRQYREENGEDSTTGEETPEEDNPFDEEEPPFYNIFKPPSFRALSDLLRLRRPSFLPDLTPKIEVDGTNQRREKYSERLLASNTSPTPLPANATSLHRQNLDQINRVSPCSQATKLLKKVSLG